MINFVFPAFYENGVDHMGLKKYNWAAVFRCPFSLDAYT